MKLLLDTHIILWALDDNPRLPLEARRFIMDEKMIFITARHRSGRQRLNICQGRIRFGLGGSKLSELCRKMGYRMLPIEDRHVMALETLVCHNQVHNDPFDRMMIAQAKADGLKFVTHDYKISFYEESCVLPV